MASKRGGLSTALTVLLIAGLVACQGPRARSQRSFAEIESLVRGKTAPQLVALLGEPDSRQKIFDSDERWIWWNYTFLAGRDVAPELRGRVVHLEIVVKHPAGVATSPSSYAEWKVDDTFGVTYRDPSASQPTES